MKPIPRKAFEFLMENQMQNSREWYQEHKPDFEEYVLRPLQDLVTALSPTLLEIDPKLITEPKTDRTISRVYRDTRFSRDKSLYRDHMWCVFMREKKLYNGYPAFFFEMTPDWFHYGCGYYQAAPAAMDAMRDIILEDPGRFEKIRKPLERQDIFRMEGELYKRSRHPGQPEALRSWLDRKNVCFTHRSTDFDLLFSDKLADRLIRDLPLLGPVYHFFLEAEARKQHKNFR